MKLILIQLINNYHLKKAAQNSEQLFLCYTVEIVSPPARRSVKKTPRPMLNVWHSLRSVKRKARAFHILQITIYHYCIDRIIGVFSIGINNCGVFL